MSQLHVAWSDMHESHGTCLGAVDRNRVNGAQIQVEAPPLCSGIQWLEGLCRALTNVTSLLSLCGEQDHTIQPWSTCLQCAHAKANPKKHLEGGFALCPLRCGSEWPAVGGGCGFSSVCVSGTTDSEMGSSPLRRQMCSAKK